MGMSSQAKAWHKVGTICINTEDIQQKTKVVCIQGGGEE